MYPTRCSFTRRGAFCRLFLGCPCPRASPTPVRQSHLPSATPIVLLSAVPAPRRRVVILGHGSNALVVVLLRLLVVPFFHVQVSDLPVHVSVPSIAVLDLPADVEPPLEALQTRMGGAGAVAGQSSDEAGGDDDGRRPSVGNWSETIQLDLPPAEDLGSTGARGGFGWRNTWGSTTP